MKKMAMAAAMTDLSVGAAWASEAPAPEIDCTIGQVVNKAFQHKFEARTGSPVRVSVLPAETWALIGAREYDTSDPWPNLRSPEKAPFHKAKISVEPSGGVTRVRVIPQSERWGTLIGREIQQALSQLTEPLQTSDAVDFEGKAEPGHVYDVRFTPQP